MRKFQIIFKCRACQQIKTRTAIITTDSLTLAVDLVRSDSVYELKNGNSVIAYDCGPHIGMYELICIQEVS